MEKQKLRKAILKNSFLFIVAFIILFFIFSRVNIMEVFDVLVNVNISYLLLLLIFSTVINFLFMPDKWRKILKCLGLTLGLRESALIHLANYPVSTFFPIRTGEFFKAYYLKNKHHFSFQKGASSIIFDNATDVVAMMFFVLVGLLFFDIRLPVKINYVIIAIVLAVSFSFFFLSKLRMKIFSAFSHLNKKSIFFFILYSIFTWGLGLLGFKVMFMSLGVEVPVSAVYALFPLVTFVSSIPVTVSGFGTREAALIFFFSSYGSAEQLVASGLLMAVLDFIIPSLIGMIFFKRFYGEMVR